MKFKRKLTKDMIFWYMIVSPLIVFLLMAIHYNHPEFGFNEIGYGLGTILTVLFPVLWLTIYLFCKYIAQLKEEPTMQKIGDGK